MQHPNQGVEALRELLDPATQPVSGFEFTILAAGEVVHADGTVD